MLAKHLTNTAQHRTLIFPFLSLWVFCNSLIISIWCFSVFLNNRNPLVRCCVVFVRCLANTAHYLIHCVLVSLILFSAVCGRKTKLCFYNLVVTESLSRLLEKCLPRAPKCPHRGHFGAVVRNFYFLRGHHARLSIGYFIKEFYFRLSKRSLKYRSNHNAGWSVLWCLPDFEMWMALISPNILLMK